MTHPDILKMERDGCLYDEPVIIEICCVCRCEIHEGEYHYDIHSDIVCENCGADYIAQFGVYWA